MGNGVSNASIQFLIGTYPLLIGDLAYPSADVRATSAAS